MHKSVGIVTVYNKGMSSLLCYIVGTIEDGASFGELGEHHLHPLFVRVVVAVFLRCRGGIAEILHKPFGGIGGERCRGCGSVDHVGSYTAVVHQLRYGQGLLFVVFAAIRVKHIVPVVVALGKVYLEFLPCHIASRIIDRVVRLTMLGEAVVVHNLGKCRCDASCEAMALYSLSHVAR